MILTWWFARQLVDASEVKNRSVDWQRETVLADHLLSNGGQTIDPTRGLLEEELVNRSITLQPESTTGARFVEHYQESAMGTRFIEPHAPNNSLWSGKSAYDIPRRCKHSSDGKSDLPTPLPAAATPAKTTNTRR